ncbi:hypothetical protein [Nitrosophilus alvini]|uniref:hypothetical protein n=1 Tax=Nitrosophilus alvini TaxID=2714855 RepID=UPI00190B856A|nr:hypothetical protein [Nitrosophilus alvini]
MSKRVALYIACAVLSTSLYAQSDNDYRLDSFEIGLQTLKMDYKEYDTGGNFLDGDSTDLFGDMNGINAKALFHLKDVYYIGASIEYTKGKSHYEGSTWGGTPLSLTKDNVSILQPEISLIGKKEYNYGTLHSKIAFGYREWKRGKSDYSGDYDETYKWKYFYIGAGYKKEIAKRVSLGFSLGYQKALSPEMKAYLYDGATFKLGNTEGFKIEIPLEYTLTERIDIIGFYRYDYWEINHSDTVALTSGGSFVTYAYEPDSKTKNSYLGIKLKYSFR